MPNVFGDLSAAFMSEVLRVTIKIMPTMGIDQTTRWATTS